MNTPNPQICPESAFDDLLEHRDPPPHAPATVPARPLAIPRPDHPREFTLVTHELSLTGAPAIVLELASLLRARGCAVRVLSLADGPLKPEFTHRGIVVETPPPLLERMARMQAQARLWAEREPRLPPRILHRLAKTLSEIAVWLWHARFWSRARGIVVVNSAASWRLAAQMPAARKAPAFWYIHERYDPQWLIPGERANSTLQRLAADGSLQMIYGSDATRLLWAGNNYPGQVRYWSGVSMADDRPHRTPGRRDRRMILNVGTVSARKGTRALVEAFALGRAEGLIPSDAELCIVGCPLPSINAEARELMRRVAQPDLHGHVRVVANVLPGAARSYYYEAAVYAHAAIAECMPLALLTAMAHGLPIVTTDVDGCKEAIVHESCGLLVAPLQARQMAEALGRLLNQPDKARAFGEAARARFAECFCVEATFEPLYETLVGRAAPGSAKT